MDSSNTKLLDAKCASTGLDKSASRVASSIAPSPCYSTRRQPEFMPCGKLRDEDGCIDKGPFPVARLPRPVDLSLPSEQRASC